MVSEIDKYKKEGFYVARGLLDQKSIRSTIASLHYTLDAQLAISPCGNKKSDIFDSLKRLYQLDINRYKKVVGSLWRKESVFQLMHNKKIIDFLHKKFGWKDIFVPGGQVVLIMANELKIPDGYFGFAPHQDFPSVQGSLDGVVIWAPLVNIDQDNFPLELIPRSHRRGLAPMINRGSNTWEVDSNWYDEDQFVSIDVGVGDVIFMSTFTIHRSSVRGGNGRYRIAVSTRFDNGEEPTFIDRAYPSAYIRSVHREQYYKGFPNQSLIDDTFS